MIIRDLIDKLSQYDSSLEIVVEWDGGWSAIDNLEVKFHPKYGPFLVADCSVYGSFRDEYND
jgi:hypothetical protein